MSDKLVRIKNLYLGFNEGDGYIPSKGEIVTYCAQVHDDIRPVTVVGDGSSSIFNSSLIGTYTDCIHLSKNKSSYDEVLFDLPFTLTNKTAIVTILIPGYMPQIVNILSADDTVKVYLINQTDANISSDLDNAPYFIVYCGDDGDGHDSVHFAEVGDLIGRDNILYDNKTYIMKVDLTATISVV